MHFRTDGPVGTDSYGIQSNSFYLPFLIDQVPQDFSRSYQIVKYGTGHSFLKRS